MTGMRSDVEPTLMGETGRRLRSIEGRTPRYILTEKFAALVALTPFDRPTRST